MSKGLPLDRFVIGKEKEIFCMKSYVNIIWGFMVKLKNQDLVFMENKHIDSLFFRRV